MEHGTVILDNRSDHGGGTMVDHFVSLN